MRYEAILRHRRYKISIFCLDTGKQNGDEASPEHQSGWSRSVSENAHIS